MKIEKILLHLLKPFELPGGWSEHLGVPKINSSLVRIITDEGIEGDFMTWSMVLGMDSEVIAKAIAKMAPHLLGRDPFDRAKIWEELTGSFGFNLNFGILAASSAMDICLWDIIGKFLNQPLHRLLGTYKHEIRAYASGLSYQSVDRYLKEIRKVKDKGYTAYKFHVQGIPDKDIQVFKTAKREFGKDLTFIADVAFSYNRRDALRVGKELESLEFFWYESPLQYNDIDGYAELCRELEIPITSENLFPGDYLRWYEKKALDIIRPVGNLTGGITDLLKCASFCEVTGYEWT